MPEERPKPGTHCVVEDCDRPAAVYVDIAGGEPMDGETAVPMCDVHAAHWRESG
jgi:hypothetical protein